MKRRRLAKEDKEFQNLEYIKYFFDDIETLENNFKKYINNNEEYSIS